jgi:hypothetical protein
MTAISSSASTKSPTFLFHCLSVPSVMLSAICGTLTVSRAAAEACRARRSAGVAVARARARRGAEAAAAGDAVLSVRAASEGAAAALRRSEARERSTVERRASMMGQRGGG